MDALVEEIAPLPQSEVHRFIHAGMEEDYDDLRNAPQLLRDFFIDAPQPDPDWLDHDAFDPGIRAFQRNANLVLSAFVAGVLIDGFSTLISKLIWIFKSVRIGLLSLLPNFIPAIMSFGLWAISSTNYGAAQQTRAREPTPTASENSRSRRRRRQEPVCVRRAARCPRTALLIHVHGESADDQWLYLPALKRVKRISSSNRSGSFMGSEFAYEDLTAPAVEKFTYRYLRDEPCGDLTCTVSRTHSRR